LFHELKENNMKSKLNHRNCLLIILSLESFDLYRVNRIDNLISMNLFLNWCSRDGVQLGPLGTAATNRLIVPATADYDDGEIGGMMIGRGKNDVLVENLPQCRFVHYKSHMSARTRIRAAVVGSQRLIA
jgi:hypothetical protein